MARAFLRSSVVSATIISRMALMRLSSKNMCSVRHRPMPDVYKRQELAFAMIDDLTAQLQSASDKGRYHPISWRHRRHVLYSAIFGAAVFAATVCLLARRRQKEQNAELRQSVSYTVRPLAGGELLYRSTGHSSRGKG